jgi:hypothetical protein
LRLKLNFAVLKNRYKTIGSNERKTKFSDSRLWRDSGNFCFAARIGERQSLRFAEITLIYSLLRVGRHQFVYDRRNPLTVFSAKARQILFQCLLDCFVGVRGASAIPPSFINS